MVVFPNAKINLGLRITSKRADGFHNLDTVFYPLPFTDALEIISQSTHSETPVIFSSSGLVIPGDTQSNLCLKAYHLLKNKFPELPASKCIYTKTSQWEPVWEEDLLMVPSH